MGGCFHPFPPPPAAVVDLEEQTNGPDRLEKKNTLINSRKTQTGVTERTPKPEYLIALATYLGVRW